MPQISATVSWHFFSFLFGKMRDPARAKRATPAMSRGSPTGVTANMEKGSIPFWRKRSLRTIRGPEPIIVTVPPRMVAKPMGIIRWEVGIEVC